MYEIEQAERLYLKKLKLVGYFYLAFSTFIILNSVIGFSSAPFYLPLANCNKIQPTQKCEKLETYSKVLYSIELICGLVLMFQGLLIMRIIDFITNVNLIKFSTRLTYIAIILYLVIMICRVGVFFEVDSLAEDLTDKENYVGSFGAFLGGSIQSEAGAVLMTCFFMCTIAICFLCNLFNIRLNTNLVQHTIQISSYDPTGSNYEKEQRAGLLNQSIVDDEENTEESNSGSLLI